LKVLVIRFSSIGDIVLTFPVLRCLKQQLPDCEVHFVTKSPFSELITASEYIDKTYYLNKSLGELSKQLKAEKYDVVIDLHNNIRSRFLANKLRIKRKYRFPKLNFLKWLYVRFKINLLPDIHVVDRYFESVKSLGVLNDKKNNQFFIKNEIDVFSLFGLKSKEYVAVAIGAQFATKQIPENKLIEILSKLNSPIVLLGGKMDELSGEQICKLLSEKQIINACGKFSLIDSASLLKQARIVLTNDTGLMHIASCFDVPLVTVWGNTTPSLGMSVYRPEKNVSIINHEVQGLSCRPCSKIGFKNCPKEHFNCMQLQDASRIAADLQA
jgi:heptosyltransferase-2